MSVKSIAGTILLAVGIFVGLVLCVLGLKRHWPKIKQFGKDVKEEADRTRQAPEVVATITTDQ